jgi:hypothetical protein
MRNVSDLTSLSWTADSNTNLYTLSGSVLTCQEDRALATSVVPVVLQTHLVENQNRVEIPQTDANLALAA